MRQLKTTLRTKTVFIFKSVKNQQIAFGTTPTDTSSTTYSTTITGGGLISF
jgi:hypothetical protein